MSITANPFIKLNAACSLLLHLCICIGGMHVCLTNLLELCTPRLFCDPRCATSKEKYTQRVLFYHEHFINKCTSDSSEIEYKQIPNRRLLFTYFLCAHGFLKVFVDIC